MSHDLSPQEWNKLVAQRFLKIWNAGGEALVDDLAAPDIVFSHSRLQEPMRGASLLKQVLAQTHDTFPDMRIEAEDVIAEGDQVVVYWTYRATHRNNVLFIVQEFGMADTMSLMLQLGALPAVLQ